MTQQMTTKVAPAYDGRTSFFAFEDAIDDWCNITEEKRGPALRNRLVRRRCRSVYKRLLDRDMLRDPNEGVNQTVFLHRFMQFMKHNPDWDLTTPDVIAAIAPRRTQHEEQQQNLSGIAAATREKDQKKHF